MLLENGLLKVDEEQQRVVYRLQKLYEDVRSYNKSSASNLFGKLFSFSSQNDAPRGVYLYGSVGKFKVDHFLEVKYQGFVDIAFLTSILAIDILSST